MDFYKIKEREGVKKGTIDVYPDFQVVRSKDLMVRGGKFYAIWDEAKGLWSTDEYDVQRLVDEDIRAYKVQQEVSAESLVKRKLLGNFETNAWMQFRKYVASLSDSYHQLDENLTFANDDVVKTDYVSRKLPYALEEGEHKAWDELVDVLYHPSERAKIEWMIGSIIIGDSKKIQKFCAFYGAPGTGKSTVINIIQWMTPGYWSSFDAKALTGNNNSFAMEVFKNNPLLAIEHDTNLSKIIDNSKFNSIVSHETMTINEKFKSAYDILLSAMLIVGTNDPIQITSAKAGITRRLIDIHPTGKTIAPKHYQALMSQIQFELGAIAWHCREVYLSMGKDYYSGYKPIEMMLQTDIFFNFIEAHYDVFREQDGATLDQAFKLYKQYCEDSLIEYKLAKYKFREELRNYFDKFDERMRFDDGTQVRSWYSGFKADRFKVQVERQDETVFSLVLDETESLFDREFAKATAQYSKENGSPEKFWSDAERVDGNGRAFTPKPSQVVSTTLSELDTSREHYVKVPVNHIVIDFDLKDAEGNKSAERNLEAASRWPSTYAEFSKSGSGIHLHYNYTGDPAELSRVYDDGIEVKVFTGDSSLRRRLSRCNNVPIASINTGALPLKEKKVITEEQVKSERALRELIMRNLRKEIHPGTKPSMDFIKKILDDAYASGLEYDVRDMRGKLMAFANNSTNNSLYCLQILKQMKFNSAEKEIAWANPEGNLKAIKPKDERLVFFDVEVFKNLFVICWKYEGSTTVVRMINPTPQQVEELLPMKLVGFNCRRYDNHILYARVLGYTNEQLYTLSKKIIEGNGNPFFGEAYNISYTDIYDYAMEKKSLKMWEVDLGIHHAENELDWDEPVPEEKWAQVAEYCANDVNATEAVHQNRKQDWVARQVLAAVAELSLNNTTQQLTARIIFGGNKKPQEQFVYTDLSEMFPGYHYEYGKSTYRDEITGEGGYVYSEPGIYRNVALLDIASMHPTSIEQLNLFGAYTEKFSELKQARIAIKHKDYDAARHMLGGKLAPFLGSEEDAKGLSNALKIAINIVYGLTSASFDNAFKDPRNIDNIVAKRGALYMIDLKHYVQEQGYQVIHIKTDSIKIPNADNKIIQLVVEHGKKYGYDFELEAIYDKLCLVNDAVYIAKADSNGPEAHWEATGAQFKHPYVFKTLFSHEPITFRDKCEARQVKSAMYLDFEDVDKSMALYEDKLHFVGKVGLFCPIKPGRGGAQLVRTGPEGKLYAVSNTKGYTFLEAEVVEKLGREDDIDLSYFQRLVDDAVEQISKYGDVEELLD